jgi:hypothetical protein
MGQWGLSVLRAHIGQYAFSRLKVVGGWISHPQQVVQWRIGVLFYVF